jgi:hypothetical protein
MGARARRVDDRIRELCAEAVAARSSHKVKSTLAELQVVLHQYTQRLRIRAAAQFSPDARIFRQSGERLPATGGNALLLAPRRKAVARSAAPPLFAITSEGT